MLEEDDLVVDEESLMIAVRGQEEGSDCGAAGCILPRHFPFPRWLRCHTCHIHDSFSHFYV